MTAYQGQLDQYRQLLIYNQGEQTQITLQTSRPGQQQSQGSGFHTGPWSAPPTLFKLDGLFVLRLEGREGQTFIEIAAGGMQTLSAAPSLMGAAVQPLQPVEPPPTASMPKSEPMEPMKPMKPMKPMRMEMGDMVMDMGSGQMTLGGSGGLSMGETASAETKADTPPTAPRTESASPKPRFCSQCGTSVKPEDRFCAQCGHKLG